MLVFEEKWLNRYDFQGACCRQIKNTIMMAAGASRSRRVGWGAWEARLNLRRRFEKSFKFNASDLIYNGGFRLTEFQSNGWGSSWTSIKGKKIPFFRTFETFQFDSLSNS